MRLEGRRSSGSGRLRRWAVNRLPWLAGAAVLGASLPLWQAWVPTGIGRWLADLAVHWQWPYALIGVGSAALWLALRARGERGGAAAKLAAALVLAALNLSWTPLPRLPRAEAAAAVPIKLASFNVHLDNRAFDAIADWASAEQPDVLALVEVTPDMQPLLARLAARYPHTALHARADPFGLAVFSRHPLQGAQLHDDGRLPPRWRATVKAPGAPFTLTVVHPMPPISAADRAERDALFDALAQQPASTRAQVIMGDFNSTPWSAGLRRVGDAGWARATTLQPTFALGRSLPLDHILATRAHWRVADAGMGPWLGSDHRPVWALLHAVRADP